VPEFHQLSRVPNRTRVADFHRRSGILPPQWLQAPCPEEIILKMPENVNSKNDAAKVWFFGIEIYSFSFFFAHPRFFTVFLIDIPTRQTVH
jgi:hypothetical protein